MNILVVDDTEFNRKLPATILRQLGHVVSEACDGPQALYSSHFEEYAAEVAAHAGLLGRTLS